MVLGGYENLEAEHVKMDLDRIKNALDNEICNLDMTVQDWAAWNDTYSFIAGLNDDYLNSNILNNTFIILEVNAIVYLDLNNTIVHAGTYDLENNLEFADSSQLIESITSFETLFIFPDNDGIHGIISTSHGFMIVASRPITDSMLEYPSNGALLMGRLFSRSLESLSGVFQVPLSYEVYGAGLQDDFTTAQTWLDSNNETVFTTVMDDNLAGYSIITDVNGTPSLILKTISDRDIFRLGLDSVNKLHIIILIFMSAVGIAALLTWDIVVARRLSDFNADVKSISKTGRSEKRIRIIGKDEISSLAKEVNRMLDSLQESELALQSTNQVLASKVEELQRSDKAALNIMEDMNETIQAIKSVEKELAAKNKELESYTYTVSHDLKAPLVTIQGFSDLLAQNYGDKLDDKARHFIDRINQGSEKLNKLTTDLLELSRAGRKMRPFSMHDFNGILGSSLESLQGRLYLRGVKVNRPADFPRVFCDEMGIYQVMNNLLGNAIDYMGDQSEPIIVLGWEDAGEEYSIWVQDNGIGIKIEDLERIFMIFERATDVQTKGTGIGLSIVKKIIEAHGGRVGVESQIGTGSKFTIYIPKRRLSDEQ